MQPIYIKTCGEFVLEGHVLPYDCYFIDNPAYNGTSQETFRKVLLRWASALSRNTKNGQTLFFPFVPDDEWTEALKGTIDGDSIVLTRGILGVPGFGIDFDNLEDFIVAPKGLTSTPASFTEVGASRSFSIRVDLDEFIQELKNPCVIDGMGFDRK